MGNGLRKSVLAVLVGLAVILVSVCDEDKSPTSASSAPATLKYISGNNQTGLRLNRLAQSFVVQVLDYSGDPVAAHKVVFEVTSLTGTLAGNGQKKQEVLTNANGMTSVYLVLGDSLGLDSVWASAVDASENDLTDSPYLFTAGVDTSGTGEDGAPDDTSQVTPDLSANRVRIMSGNNQGMIGQYYEGQLLPMPLVVQVLDTTFAGVDDYPAEGAPVSGFPVLFTVYGPEGAGVEPTISSEPGGGPSGTGLLQATTDVDGLAAVRLKLAEKFGGGTAESNQNNHRVEVVAVFQDGSQDSVIFFATAVPKTPIDTAAAVIPDVDRIELIGGDSQTGVPGELLDEPVVLAVYDSVGEPVTGAEVTAIIKDGGGLIGAWGQDPSQAELMSLVTDSEGLVRLAWRLGPLPERDNEILVVLIKPDGSSSSVPIKATGVDPALGPDNIALVSGKDQTGEAGTILPLPLVVRVFNKEGQPVPGVVVTFTVTRGFGSISPEGTLPVINEMQTVTTDEQGVAAVTMLLGPGPDLDNEVVAQILRPDGTVVRELFKMQARPKSDTANDLVIMSGNYQGLEGNYTVATELPLPLVVGVFDSRRTEMNPLGAPISNFPVLFEAFSPSGDAGVTAVEGVEPAGTGRLEALTDEDGLAAVRLTMGSRTGSQDTLALDYLLNNNRVVAVAVFADGSQDSVLFFATAVPGAPVNIAAAGGTALGGIAGESLSELTVVVTDVEGNSNAGVPVSFVIDKSPGGGLISQTNVWTDIDGYATSGLDSLSTVAGDMEVSAVNGNLSGSPVTFTITVSADEAETLLAAGGDNQVGTIGTALSNSLKVMILDQYGNPKSGDLVTFTVTEGSASLSVMVMATTTDGTAETKVTPFSTAVRISARVWIKDEFKEVFFNLTAEEEEE